MRNITVSFEDGSSHVYNNAPDDVTPDQVSARAQKEFGRPVTSMDGGRPPASEPSTPSASQGASPAPSPSNGVSSTTGQTDLTKMSGAALPPREATKSAATPAMGATPTEQPKPDRSLMGDLGHNLGLAGRATINTLAAPVAMVADFAAAPVNAGLELYDKMRDPTADEQANGGKKNGFRFPSQAQALNSAMDVAGVAKPENATERVVQDIATGVGSAATGIGIGGVLSKAAGPLARAAGAMMTAAPNMQLASGAASGVASGLTREAGGGAGAQMAAGLIGAAAPSVLPFTRDASIRGVMRGGEQGRQRVEDTINTFEGAAGTTPTVGQATGSHAIQAAETGLSNVIGSSGIMVRRGEIQSRAMDESVRKLSAALAPSASGAEAGEAITSGVNTFRDSMKNTQQRLYAQLDKYIPADTAVSVNKTQEALQSLNEGITGAPSISRFFQNSKISAIERALLDDLNAASLASGAPGMSTTGMAKAPGQLPYQAVQKLRSMVGREIADNSLVADVPRSKWRALYAALSDDMGGAAQQAGPQAEQAWARANRFTKLGMERMDQLETIVNRETPEKVFKAATGGLAEGGTTIRRVMKSLPIENRQEVAAAVLQRLGRAKNGMQNDVADVFSSETFLTNLAAMSPEAKSALFSSSGFPGLRYRVDQMARMASDRRDGAKVFSNPSGTARQTGMFAWMATLATGFAAGNPVAIATALGAPVAANVVAKKLTSPEFVRGLAERTEMNKALIPSLINASVMEGSPRGFDPTAHATYAESQKKREKEQLVRGFPPQR